jgi:hypothetical protein
MATHYTARLAVVATFLLLLADCSPLAEACSENPAAFVLAFPEEGILPRNEARDLCLARGGDLPTVSCPEINTQLNAIRSTLPGGMLSARAW